MTNAGGPAIACADACGAAGLRVDPLHDATRSGLARALPPAAAGATPSTCSPPRQRRTSGARSRRSRPTRRRRDHRDLHPGAARPRGDRRCARSARPRGAPPRRVPGAAVGHDPGASAAAPPARRDVPVFTTPEHAARALGHAARHAASPPPPAAGRRAAGRRRSRRRRGGHRRARWPPDPAGWGSRTPRACSAPTASRWRRRASRPRRMAPDAAPPRSAATWR